MTKYWVGGSGNWSDATNHWATSSGGSPGVGNTPTQLENVIFDNQSGLNGGTVTIDTFAECASVTTETGVSWSMTTTSSNEFSCFGSLTLESGLTTFHMVLSLLGTGLGNSFRQNGAMLAGITLKVDGDIRLYDDLLLSGTFRAMGGTFDANGYDVIAENFDFSSDDFPTIQMGSGNWIITSNDTDNPSGPNQPVWYVGQNSHDIGDMIIFEPDIAKVICTDVTDEPRTFVIYSGEDLGTNGDIEPNTDYSVTLFSDGYGLSLALDSDEDDLTRRRRTVTGIPAYLDRLWNHQKGKNRW